jgi:hypothetical protein
LNYTSSNKKKAPHFHEELFANERSGRDSNSRPPA